MVPSDPLIYRPSIPADIESVQQEDDVCTLVLGIQVFVSSLEF